MGNTPLLPWTNWYFFWSGGREQFKRTKNKRLFLKAFWANNFCCPRVFPFGWRRKSFIYGFLTWQVGEGREEGKGARTHSSLQRKEGRRSNFTSSSSSFFQASSCRFPHNSSSGDGKRNKMRREEEKGNGDLNAIDFFSCLLDHLRLKVCRCCLSVGINIDDTVFFALSNEERHLFQSIPFDRLRLE